MKQNSLSNVFIYIDYKNIINSFYLQYYVQNKMLKAIAIQQNDTYGLLRSPILANFQNVPKGLKKKILFFSSQIHLTLILYISLNK